MVKKDSIIPVVSYRKSRGLKAVIVRETSAAEEEPVNLNASLYRMINETKPHTAEKNLTERYEPVSRYKTASTYWKRGSQTQWCLTSPSFNKRIPLRKRS